MASIVTGPVISDAKPGEKAAAKIVGTQLLVLECTVDENEFKTLITAVSK